MKELKSFPQHVKSIEGRSVTGIFSVFGNQDSSYWQPDIVHAGAFKKTLKERKDKIYHLWQHNFYEPPIAVVEAIKELSRDELPKEVLKVSPDITGGMEVTRRYLDTPKANEVFANISEGVPLEMSFGFDAIKFDFVEMDGKTVRNLREVKLYETSDVLWGANSATLASKALLDMAKHNPDFLTQLKALLEPSKVDTRVATSEPSNGYSELLAAIKAFGSVPELLEMQETIRRYGQGV